MESPFKLGIMRAWSTLRIYRNLKQRIGTYPPSESRQTKWRALADFTDRFLDFGSLKGRKEHRR